MLHRQYVVVARIGVDGRPGGAHLRAKAWTKTGATRLLNTYKQFDFHGKSLSLEHVVWPREEWDDRPDCLNSKFYCLDCTIGCRLHAETPEVVNLRPCQLNPYLVCADCSGEPQECCDKVSP